MRFFDTSMLSLLRRINVCSPPELAVPRHDVDVRVVVREVHGSVVG
jgi:hypothetical protein